MLIIEDIFFGSLSKAKLKGSAHVLPGEGSVKIWMCSCWEKDNFVMIKPEKFGHLHLVYHFTIPLRKLLEWQHPPASPIISRLGFLCFVGVHIHHSVHCMSSFLSVRPVDQWWRQLAVRFYSKWYIIRSGVCVLARKIRLAMTGGITIIFIAWIKFL